MVAKKRNLMVKLCRLKLTLLPVLLPTSTRPMLCKAKLKLRKNIRKICALPVALYAVRSVLSIQLGMQRARMLGKLVHFRLRESQAHSIRD